MDIILNILIIIVVSIITCILYDFVKSYLLTKKLKELNNINNNSNEYSWEDFWKGNIPVDNDFTDKEE